MYKNENEPLIKVINAIDNAVVDPELNEDNQKVLAEIRRKTVNALLKQYNEDVLVGEMGICTCECHHDTEIMYDTDQCVVCKCYNEFRNVNRP